MYNYENLLIFATTVECGSFSSTAKQMNMTHSTISRKMANLERSLGGNLFVIYPNSLKITDFGKEIYNQFKNEIDLLNRINLKIESLKYKNEEPSGTLRIQLPLSTSYHLITPKLMSFKRKYPKIDLQIMYINKYIDLITENLDLAVLNHIPQNQDQKIRKIYSNKARLYCTTLYAEKYGTPKTLDQLQEHLFTGIVHDNLIIEDYIEMVNQTTNEVIKIQNGNGIATNHDIQNLQLLHSNEIIVGLLDSTYNKIGDQNVVPVLPNYFNQGFNFYLIKNPCKNQRNIQLFSDFLEECIDMESKIKNLL